MSFWNFDALTKFEQLTKITTEPSYLDFKSSQYRFDTDTNKEKFAIDIISMHNALGDRVPSITGTSTAGCIQTIIVVFLFDAIFFEKIRHHCWREK